MMDELRIACIKKEKTLVGPKRINVHITNNCNFECTYCRSYVHFPKDKRKTQEMDFKTFKNIIDGCSEMGIETVSLSGGGEPTLHKRIEEMIKYAKDNGLAVSLITNGSFGHKLLKSILLLDSITISLSAASEKTHTELQSKSKNMFKGVLKNLLFLSKVKSRGSKAPYVKIYFVVNAKNYKEVEKIFSLAQKMRVDELNVKMMIPSLWNKEIHFTDKSILEFRKILKKIKESKDFGKQGGNLEEILRIVNDPGFLDKLDVYSLNTDFFRAPACYNGWYYLTINESGDVRPCCQVKSLVVGNVNKKSIKDIWKSKEFEKLRLDGKRGVFGNKFKECNFCYEFKRNRKIHHKLTGG